MSQTRGAREEYRNDCDNAGLSGISERCAAQGILGRRERLSAYGRYKWTATEQVEGRGLLDSRDT